MGYFLQAGSESLYRPVTAINIITSTAGRYMARQTYEA